MKSVSIQKWFLNIVSIYSPVVILSWDHYILLSYKCPPSHCIMQYVITAETVKTINSYPTWTHKDYIWYLLKPAGWLDTNPISGQFCNCEHALKSSSHPAGRPAHAWCSLETVWNQADQRWQMGTEIPETCVAVTFPHRQCAVTAMSHL